MKKFKPGPVSATVSATVPAPEKPIQTTIMPTDRLTELPEHLVDPDNLADLPEPGTTDELDLDSPDDMGDWPETEQATEPPLTEFQGVAEFQEDNRFEVMTDILTDASNLSALIRRSSLLSKSNARDYLLQLTELVRRLAEAG